MVLHSRSHCRNPEDEVTMEEEMHEIEQRNEHRISGSDRIEIIDPKDLVSSLQQEGISIYYAFLTTCNCKRFGDILLKRIGDIVMLIIR